MWPVLLHLQAFCWLCGGATGRAHTWSNIENHSCGRYKDEAEERVRDLTQQHVALKLGCRNSLASN